MAATVLAVAASAISILAIGFLLASVLPTVRTTQAVAAALFFPAIFVSGAMWPREALPEFAQRVGDALPITYAVRAIREAWTAGTMDWVALGILAAVTVIAVGIALRTFRWESR
jgi:ABC-2 type transport system permease protein